MYLQQNALCWSSYVMKLDERLGPRGALGGNCEKRATVVLWCRESRVSNVERVMCWSFYVMKTDERLGPRALVCDEAHSGATASREWVWYCGAGRYCSADMCRM